MREFFGWPPLLAVAVLAVNDALLKPAFHNAVTGKLSDFAGCFFLPLYVSALLSVAVRLPSRQRVLIGAALTTALLASIKLSTVAASSVGRALEVVAQPLRLGAMRIVADPTDLMALSMVPCAIAYAAWVARPDRQEQLT